jgi:hypothetical protein
VVAVAAAAVVVVDTLLQLTVLTAECVSGNFSAVKIIQQFSTPGICGITATSDETDTEYSVLVTVTRCGGGGSNGNLKFIVIGVCVGVVVLMVVAALIIFCLYKRR